MPRTPDNFPGTRIEESVVFISGSELPANSGEQLYASGTVSGSGFFFNEAGRHKRVVSMPTQAGQVLFAFTDKKFVPAMPMTSPQGWLVNSEGYLLVSASLED